MSHFNIMSTEMHWARWGDPLHHDDLPESVDALLAAAFADLRPVPQVGLEEVDLPPIRLSGAALEALQGVVGEAHLHTDRESRVRHTRGKSTPDLLAVRAGDAAAAPDAVIAPDSHEDVVEILALARWFGIVVIPYGGGTSVVGGLTAERSRGVVAVDLARLDRLVEVDAESSTATLEAGVRAPAAEAMLSEHGLTLGHFPQSFEYATIGGFAATRSSGQSSSGYGRFDEMVVGLEVATPAGTWELGAAPASAAGPDLRQLVLGSEGTLGIITRVRLTVRPVPETKVYEGWRFPDFACGRDAVRRLVQEGLNPTVLRLSDETETALNLADPAAIGGDSTGGVAMICGYEGSAAVVSRMRVEVSPRLAESGGSPLGEGPGARWAAGRFDAPYLRDALMDRGVIVETLETAAFWSDLDGLYRSVQGRLDASLRSDGATPIVLCHISHVYRTGASLYFTAAFDGGDDPAGRWHRAKVSASEEIRRHGATITHHHAVGRDHKRWYAEEIGPIGVAVLRSVKHAVDPDGVLNPGVLIPDGESRA